jgi:tripartite ATP-independent transporter DctM subunit
LIIFLLFVILLLLGIPIAVALLVPAITAIFFYPELPIQLMSARLANSYLSATLLAIPLFIFAAQILTDIEVTDDIFGFLNRCVGHVRGGLAHVNVLASIVFAGMSGSTAADAAGLGKVEIKAMNDQGYPVAFSAAVTAASATIGPIIPPSIAAIIYASIAGVSSTRLLLGGFLPGLIMAALLMVGISLVSKQRGFPKTKFAGFKGIWSIFLKASLGMTVPFILIGGMLFGVFTPTEAAAVAVIVAIIIGIVTKKLTYKKLVQAIRKTGLDAAAILCTFLGASLIGLLVTRLNFADATINFIARCTSNPQVLLLFLNIFLLILGCLLDPTCIIILTTPILVPLVMSFGIDPIHFGIVMILNLMLGNLTPPMGGLLFVTCEVAGIRMPELLKECWPFMLWLFVALLIITFVPQTVLWFPGLIIK